MPTSITITGSRSGCKGTEEKSEAKYYNEKKSNSLTASDFILHLKAKKKKKKKKSTAEKWASTGTR